MLSTSTSQRAYFDNAAGRVAEHPGGFAVVKWKPGSRQLADFQAVLTHLDQLLRLRTWSKLLADQRDMAPFTADETAWVTDVWLPKAVGEGPYRYAAILLPTDVFARLASKSVLSTSHSQFVAYQFCDDEATAAAWLKQQA
ncbi:hypothetical protein F0P96_05715 [Hymenobacter busanensis]|uniref:Uncharacterized protein n=1 Tax=Hymenobacter busanensis TaxID=2607656 RepID=A0A7L5A0D5_9BACT|nr:hypothetical protein [Hymenobacter busanensis]KAA9338331.1 hypothetical protein F0P96_05715 [Hymenobacter busanensis]QHJ09244.1 hypothetical protein GUY19_18895 [Hymenobacter busanensis]